MGDWQYENGIVRVLLLQSRRLSIDKTFALQAIQVVLHVAGDGGLPVIQGPSLLHPGIPKLALTRILCLERPPVIIGKIAGDYRQNRLSTCYLTTYRHTYLHQHCTCMSINLDPSPSRQLCLDQVIPATVPHWPLHRYVESQRLRHCECLAYLQGGQPIA